MNNIVNINFTPNKKNLEEIDHLQIGQESSSRRYSGLILDKSAPNSTAYLFMLNDKVVDLEEFKKERPELLKEIEAKKNDLFEFKKTENYNSKLRMNTISEIPILTDKSKIYSTSENFGKMKNIQVGLTKFDKKADKTFWTIARDFVTAKETRDNIVDKFAEIKENFKTLISTKSSLCAENLELAFKLQEANHNLNKVSSEYATELLLRDTKIDTIAKQDVKLEELKKTRSIEESVSLGTELFSSDSLDTRISEIRDEFSSIANEIDKHILDLHENYAFFTDLDTAKQLIENQDFELIGEMIMLNDIVSFEKDLSLSEIQKYTELAKNAKNLAEKTSTDYESLVTNLFENVKQAESPSNTYISDAKPLFENKEDALDRHYNEKQAESIVEHEALDHTAKKMIDATVGKAVNVTQIQSLG